MEIDWSKLSRDYRLEPVKINEQINRDDLFYLYITLNLSKKVVCDIIGTGAVGKWLKIYKIEKTKEQKNECRRQTNLKRYGCINVSGNNEIKAKKVKTLLKNYGVTNAAKSEIIKDRMKKTNQEKYGVDNVMQNTKIKQKLKESLLDKYGVDNINKLEEFKIKQKQTMIERYGADNASKIAQFQDKKKQTNLIKYNSEYLYGSEYFKNKTKQTWLDKYGQDNPMRVPEIKQKVIDKLPQSKEKEYQTKKRNNSFHISKPQRLLGDQLREIFPNLKEEYKDNFRYPYKCDFYIPELDLFIELNFFWMHGKEPYNPDNISHQQILNIWREKAKTSKNYKQAIDTWTRRDVEKIQVAKSNNLNYLVFYNKQQFLDWYNQLGK